MTYEYEGKVTLKPLHRGFVLHDQRGSYEIHWFIEKALENYPVEKGWDGNAKITIELDE